jgi:hypothetical protein
VCEIAAGSLASATPARSRCSRSIAPYGSSVKAVANRIGRSSRDSATATLAALPPANSVTEPSARCTTSTSASPTTRTT